MPVISHATSSLSGDDSLRTILITDTNGLSGNDIHSLIPRDALKFALTAILGVTLAVGIPINTLHRIKKPLLAVIVNFAFGHTRSTDNAF